MKNLLLILIVIVFCSGCLEEFQNVIDTGSEEDVKEFVIEHKEEIRPFLPDTSSIEWNDTNLVIPKDRIVSVVSEEIFGGY